MQPVLLEMIGYIVAIIVGGGLTKILTIRAEKRKITGEGAVAEANAAKTYHEISMDLIKNLQAQADKLSSEVEQLRQRVYGLNRDLDEKERLLHEEREERERERALYETRIKRLIADGGQA